MAKRPYEIPEVEGDTWGRGKKRQRETSETFRNKESMFKGKRRLSMLFDKMDYREIEMKAL